jgi:drug/metabolite transporter (DMT)-like permease
VALLDEPIGAGTIGGFALVVAGCWFCTRPAARRTAGKVFEPSL